MKMEKSKDGHPAVTFEFPNDMYEPEQGEYGLIWHRLKAEVARWLKDNIPEGRYQINGGQIIFLDEQDRFHFVMRWR